MSSVHDVVSALPPQMPTRAADLRSMRLLSVRGMKLKDLRPAV